MRVVITDGLGVVGLDIQGEGPFYGDIRIPSQIIDRFATCEGIIDLAVLSSVPRNATHRTTTT